MVWTAVVAIYLGGTRYEVNTHRNTTRKRRSECWYSVKIASNWNFQNVRQEQISARSVHFWQRERFFYQKISKKILWTFFLIHASYCININSVLTNFVKRLKKSWDILENDEYRNLMSRLRGYVNMIRIFISCFLNVRSRHWNDMTAANGNVSCLWFELGFGWTITKKIWIRYRLKLK